MLHQYKEHLMNVDVAYSLIQAFLGSGEKRDTLFGQVINEICVSLNAEG